MSNDTLKKQVLLLHGSRQTGQLLLGRMDKLRKTMQKSNLELVAPDALYPHPDDEQMRHWWNRDGDSCVGLEDTIRVLQDLWASNNFVGVLGFSMGARLAHLVTLCHERQPTFFPGLSFTIMVAGYEVPLPPELDNLTPDLTASHTHPQKGSLLLHTPSLHVYGTADKLITSEQSRSVMANYANPMHHVHEGGHHVPMRAASVRAYSSFMQDALQKNTSVDETAPYPPATPTASAAPAPIPIPDEETAQAQADEVEALTAIFPEECFLLSCVSAEDGVYEHPIVYKIDLPASDEGVWPPLPITLRIEYPYNYPQDCLPLMKLIHDNNVMQFSTSQAAACLQIMQQAGQAEEGMPCVLSCVYAARDYFESGAIVTEKETAEDSHEEEGEGVAATNSTLPKPATAERIHQCNLEGLEIALSILQRAGPAAASDGSGWSQGKGGSWTYTIGLVGKPSAGKSTYFNAATAFARQRDDADNAIGGATMAPHPFTTIDPNVGVCLVPAPQGSCPEEGYQGSMMIGSTHGRDNLGRRLVPALLQDVAGLVPGAFQGRGRGNKFLNDLTDADVLIHVLDASGSADTEGNVVGIESDGTVSAGASHPLNDLAWIRNELIEWVYANLMHKWATIRNKGRSKLSGMFSGYGQNQAVTHEIFTSVDKHLEEHEQRDHAIDHLDQWDAGDVHRLVSAFLGVRFPMALAMNKCDLPTSQLHVKDIQAALPIHGAHVAIPLSARSEMSFIRRHIEAARGSSEKGKEDDDNRIPTGVWQCLQSAVTLREPVLVFPVCDMVTYQPLPGLANYATGDPSLPNVGMVSCLEAAGGKQPTLWDANQRIYVAPGTKKSAIALRDAIVMKPGSTVENVFLTLKRLGALSGDFIRAEGAGSIGEKAKLVPKFDVVTKSTRILKIMTSKRSSWQDKR